MKHPNTVVGAGAGLGPGVLVVWLLGRFGVDVGAEVGAAVASGVAGLVLFVGRNGLRGVWDRVWRGQPRTE